MRREKKATSVPFRPCLSCYSLTATAWHADVERVSGCRDCPFRMSCQNPANTGELLRVPVDPNDY